MAERRTSIHGEWSSRLAFILAATGSAVGLGNIWKFPYITGEHGGGAFVLVYLLCIAFIGIPVMMGEVLIGRRGRRSPINTMRVLAEEEGKSRYWQYLGWSGVVAGFLILSYYSVIAGMAVAYIARTASGMFSGASPERVAEVFAAFTGDPEKLFAWHTLFMALTLVVVARGVRSGLEQAVRWLMPALFILLLVLVGYAMSTADFGAGLKFMFAPNFHKLDWNGVLIAMGHAFFTLSLGMGAIMVYGSYMPHGASIARTSVAIALMDTVVALLAGMAIFPIVFANGLAPDAGPGLIFKTLPVAFGHMWGGSFFGVLFFILLAFAAWTSAISLIEPAVAWLVENHGMSRINAVVFAGGISWVLGLGTVFSYNLWAHKTLLGMTFFGLLDYLTANIMLPLGGLAIAVFAAWVMSRGSTEEELATRAPWVYKLWRIVLRYLTPVAIMIIFLNVIGVI
jgi:NSS family neurotransmitter:Na+ symporter